MNVHFIKALFPVLLFLFVANLAIAQEEPAPTSFETGFGPGEPTGTWYSWASGFTPTFDTEAGEMTVTYVKTFANSWDRLVQWVGPFDLEDNPYYHLRLKSDEDRTVFVDFKDGADVTVRKTIQLIGDNQYRLYLINLTEDIFDFDMPEDIREIQFDVGPGLAVSGTLVFDEVKLGEAAIPSLKPPTIDPIADMVLAASSGTQVIDLTGISDGDGMSEPIAISASTDNEALITNLVVDYTSPNPSGTLTFDVTPDMEGQATIFVELTDEGAVENTQTVSFMVVIAEYGGTGGTFNFADGELPDGISGPQIFNVSVENQALRVNVNRNGNRWAGLLWEFDAVYDLSDNPYLNFKIKTQNPQVFQVFLVDVFGNGYEVELIQTQFVFNELVPGKNEYRQNKLLPGDNYVLATYDFTGANANIVDIGKVAGIRMVSNGTALSFTGTYFIEELKIGSDAGLFAYVAQVSNHSFYINSTTRTVLVPDIKNAESLNLSGGEGLIENVEVHPIIYTNFVENNRPVQYGYTHIEFDLVENASGTETLTLNALGSVGYDDVSITFDVTVSDNMPPTLDPLADIEVKTGDAQIVKLSGISDGDRDVIQQLTVTAISSALTVIDNFEITHEQGSQYANLEFSSLAPGVTDVTVTVTDSEDAIVTQVFTVSSFASLNAPPTIDQPEDQTVFNTVGSQSYILSGIGDGDDDNQQLTIIAESSDPDIIPHPVINYTQGMATAELIVTPVADSTGLVTITVTVADDGGNAENNGNQQVSTSFGLRSVVPPVTGFTFNLDDPDILDLFKPEGLGSVFFLDVVDTLGSKALRVKMNNKWTFGGMWVDFPTIADLSEYPIISFDVLSIDNNTYHWNYFYDAHGSDPSINRNIENSEDKKYLAPANEWATLTFDYRYPGDMNNTQGEPIDGSLIQAVLLNLHDHLTAWPFTDYSGVIYLRNIAVGDQAEFGPMTKYVTIDQVPDQSIYLNEHTRSIMLTGISDGGDSAEGIEVSVNSTQTQFVPVPQITDIRNDGTALLTFEPLATGSSNISISLTKEGSEPKTMSFMVRVLDPTSDASVVTINRSATRQTIHGLGTFQNNIRWNELYVDELGASALRIGIIENQWEPVNDNDDPYVLNMAGFNYDAFNFDYYRDLKERGVETFILTSWSPPAWMKRNFSLDHREQAVEWEKTDNILEPYYYEEFAESMVAVVKAFKQEADIDIKAIGLQNEPFFNEPYASAILSGEKFAELIEVVGNRFALEGLGNVGFFMPEQVFGLGWGDYSNEGYLSSLQANPVADAYTDFFAVHGYDGSGITPGFPSYSNWTNLFNLVQAGDNPKELWMTETHIGYQGWQSALQLAGALHGSLWAGNISLWTNWGFGDMQLTRNTPNSSFYTSMNYFKHIRPGAVRVETESNHEDILATAFENPDGRFTVVIINKGTSPVSVKMQGDNLPSVFRAYRTSRFENFEPVREDFESGENLILSPGSVTTFITEDLFMRQVADITVGKNTDESSVTILDISNAQGNTNGLNLMFEYTNPELLQNISLGEIQNDGTATLVFTPAEDQIGFSQVTVTLSDENGNNREMVFFINVIESDVYAEQLNTPRILIYPNPARSHVMIELDQEVFDFVSVVDINGRTVLHKNLNGTSISLDTSALGKGVYLIHFSGKETKIVKKLMIQ